MANRRIHPRQRVTSPAYVDLGPANGGLVRNVSECGLALTAIAKLAGDELLSMRFELPKVHDWIEARGRIVWLSQSGKEAGLRFEQLPEAERKKIKNWISTAQSVNEQSSEKTAQEREAALDTMNVPQRAESQEPVVSPQARNTNETRIQERSPGQLEEPVAEFTTRAGHDGGPSQGAQEVLNAPHLKEASRRTPQRRAHARQTGSLEYVDLGPANGGMLLNLGEGGLALVSAMKLIGNQLTSIRFRLPNLQDPIEVRGRIVWLSESQKRAGIRFEELSADVLQSINRWISAEQSGNKEHGQDTAPIEKSFETTALVKPQEPLEEPVVAPALSEGTDRMERPQLSETGIPHPPEEPVPEFTMPMSDVEPPKDERDVSNMPQQLEGTSRKDERRAHARQPVGFLEYVDLGPANGGMLLNLGEGGLALTAAEKLTGDRLRMRLQLSGRQERIEASAQIVWLSESKKEAGVRFDELSADALQEIKNWISTEKCGHKESREGAAQDHKTFEPTGLPKQGEAGHEPLVFLAMAQITDELQERQPPGVHALLQSGKPAEPRYLTKPYVRPVPALLGVREPQDSATWRSIERRSVAGVRQRSRARSASVLALVALVSFGAGMVIARRFRGPGSSERTETKMERVEANGVSAGTDRQSAEALAVRAGQQPNRVRSQLKEDT